MAYTLTVRLNTDETGQLRHMVHMESCAAENLSEFVRLLLAREWNRRQGTGVPAAIQYQTAFRIGRPLENFPFETSRANGHGKRLHGNKAINHNTDAVPVALTTASTASVSYTH